jgi:hypothetical protein
LTSDYGLYSVHITPKRGTVRRHICFKSTLPRAERIADKLLHGMKGATVEIFRERFNTGAELVSVVCGGRERKQKESERQCA